MSVYFCSIFLRDGEMSNVKWQVKQSCDYLPFDALVGVHLLDEESRIPTCAAIILCIPYATLEADS